MEPSITGVSQETSERQFDLVTYAESVIRLVKARARGGYLKGLAERCRSEVQERGVAVESGERTQYLEVWTDV
jgi:hypothetical protein